MRRIRTALAMAVLACATPQAGASPTTAGETAAGTMSQPMSNFSNEANTAKSNLGIQKQDYSGAYGATGGSNGTFSASGNMQCAAGQQRYIGGVGVLINSCTTSGPNVQSLNVSVCNKVRDEGMPCTGPDYTGNATAVPGTPLALGADTLTFTCTGLDCGVSLSLQRSLSVTGPTISAQAQQAAQNLGNSGLVSQLTTVINSQSLQNDLNAEASVGTCYNNQVNDLNSTGKISNCAGTYTLSMYNPGAGLNQFCNGANGGVSWEQSCLESQPITVSQCQSTLECISTQNTTQVSCQTGTIQQVVIDPANCGPVQTLPVDLVNEQTLYVNSWWNTVYGTTWNNFYRLFTPPIMTYLLNISTLGKGYVTFNQSYRLLVNGSNEGIITNLVFNGIYFQTALGGATIDGPDPFVFTNYTPAYLNIWDPFDPSPLYFPIIQPANLNAFVPGGDSFQLCSGPGICNSLTVQQTPNGAVYTCSGPAGAGGSLCPSGFTLLNGQCYENVPVNNSCTQTGTTPITVQGALSGELVNYNCDTCATYQNLAP